MRPNVEGEHGPWPHGSSPLTHTLVRQVGPGAQLRQPLGLRDRVYLNTEAVCRELWNELAAEHTVGEVAERMAAIARKRSKGRP